VSNYADHSEDKEAFMVFGFPKTSQTQALHWEQLFNAGKEIDYAEFFNTMSQLPIQWIAEKTLVYSVVDN